MEPQRLISRERLIRILLWSLAIAAASGVLAVFLTDREYILRVTAMGFVTAACAGLLLPLSKMADAPRTRAAGMLGMTLCVVEFLLSVALIWSVFGWRSLDEQLALTMAFLAYAGVPGMAFILLRTAPGGSVAGRTGAALAAVTLAVFLIAIWMKRGLSGLGADTVQAHLWESGFALSATGALAALALIGIGAPGDRRHWRFLGVAACAAALLMLLYAIWIRSSPDIAPLVCVFSVAIFVTYANLAMLVPLGGGQVWIRYATLAAGGATALFIDLDAIFQPGADDVYGFRRFATGAGIVTASGTLALLVLARLHRRPDYEPGRDGPLRRITVDCPRCRRKQSLAIGDARCEGCGLRIHTRIELPLCPACGHDTATLAGDRCPECGTVIGAEAGARD